MKWPSLILFILAFIFTASAQRSKKIVPPEELVTFLKVSPFDIQV